MTPEELDMLAEKIVDKVLSRWGRQDASLTESDKPASEPIKPTLDDVLALRAFRRKRGRRRG